MWSRRGPLVKEWQAICDHTAKDYMNQGIREINWNQVASHMIQTFSEEELEKAKLKTVGLFKNSPIKNGHLYTGSRNKMKSSFVSGMASEDVALPKWVYYAQMRFLDSGAANISSKNSLAMASSLQDAAADTKDLKAACYLWGTDDNSNESNSQANLEERMFMVLGGNNTAPLVMIVLISLAVLEPLTRATSKLCGELMFTTWRRFLL